MRRGVTAGLGAACCAAVLAGCAVDQHKEIATYRDVLDKGAAPAPAYDGTGPLTLVDALALANANNERLALSGEDYLQALIAKDRAASAFLPTLSLEPEYTLQDETNLGASLPLVNSFEPREALDVPLKVGLDVNPASSASRVAQSEASVRARRWDLLAAQQTVLMDTARAYFQVVQAERRVGVLTHSLKVQERRLRDVSAMGRAGIVRPLDVSQTRAQTAGTRVDLVVARDAARNGRAALALLIGAPRVEGPLSESFEVPQRVPGLDALMDVARRSRPDLGAVRARERSRDEALHAAWNEYFPSISLDLSYFLKRDSFPSDVNWIAAIGVRLPLFSAGLIHEDVLQAWSMLRQAHLRRSLLDRTIRRQVTASMNDLNDASDRLAALREQVDAAQQAMNQADASYKAGLATNLERLTAQQQLLAAQLNQATATYDRAIAYLGLLRSVGRLGFASLEDSADALAASPPRASP